jgi:prepilin-type N-terminal cleavage/methylation domain-containing protein
VTSPKFYPCTAGEKDIESKRMVWELMGWTSRHQTSGDKIRQNRGFTLIELLVVIAIIAILAAILVVAIRKGIQAAQKARAASHMRQIILAYETYIQGWGGELKTIAVGPEGTAHDWIAELAKRGYLDDPRLVAFDFDSLVNQYAAAGFFYHFFGAMPKQIWNKSGNTFGDGFKGMPLSLCFVSNLDTRKATVHTPLIWSRGLNGDGTWNLSEGSSGDGSDGGIWSNTGGLVGFMGGKVEWLTSLKGVNELPKWDGSGSTSNVREAVNDDAEPFDWKGKVSAGDTSSAPPSTPPETEEPGESEGTSEDPGEIDPSDGDSGDSDEETPIENDDVPTEPPGHDEVFEFGETDWASIWGGNNYDNALAVSTAVTIWSWGKVNPLDSTPPLGTAATCLANAFLAASGINYFTQFYSGNMGLTISSLLTCDTTNILPTGFNNLLSADPNQLDNFKNALSSAAQGMTEAEQNDYDTYVALYTDLLNEVKDKDSTDAGTMTTDYLDEHFTGHTTPSKGNILALATMAVDIESYRR